MKKQLLYLIPLLLTVLSATPISLYKDKVDFLISKNPDAQFEDFAAAATTISPAHWKMLDYQENSSANFSAATFSFNSAGNPVDTPDAQASEMSESEPLYKGAAFRGFPFAAYFSKNSTTTFEGGSSSFSASGYSWLWAIINVSLIVATLVFSFIVNRKRKEAAFYGQVVQPFGNSTAENSVYPQPGGFQQGVIRPTMPPQQPQQQNSPSPQPESRPPSTPPQT
ncbi:hypothetical protein KY385_03080 [Candidatus Parcubacteria bacterium]|nr:hypothetical protein [Candidatus Parcubacteria bacterium]